MSSPAAPVGGIRAPCRPALAQRAALRGRGDLCEGGPWAAAATGTGRLCTPRRNRCIASAVPFRKPLHPIFLLETGEKGARLDKAVGAGDGRVAARRRAKKIERRVAESATLRGGVEHAIGCGGQRPQLDVACRRCGRARFAPILLSRNPVVCTRLADAIVLREKFRKLDPRADVAGTGSKEDLDLQDFRPFVDDR